METVYFLGKINTLSEILFVNIENFKNEKNISKEFESQSFQNMRSVSELIVKEILNFVKDEEKISNFVKDNEKTSLKSSCVMYFFGFIKKDILENEAIRKLEYFNNIEKFFRLENVILYFLEIQSVHERIIEIRNNFIETVKKIEC